MAKKKKLESEPIPLKLLIDPGKNRQEGFTGVGPQAADGVDTIIENLSGFPWPFDGGTVDEIVCGKFFCTLTGPERLSFLDECWRILKEKSQLMLAVPARGSNQSLMDPFFKWPPVAEDFFYFANREWRENNDCAHYPVTCNYDWTYGFSLDTDIQNRNEEMQRLAIKHGRNAAHDLHVCLTKIP